MRRILIIVLVLLSGCYDDARQTELTRIQQQMIQLRYAEDIQIARIDSLLEYTEAHKEEIASHLNQILIEEK